MALTSSDQPDLLEVGPSQPLHRSSRYPDVKDPCVVHDGARWHLFATGCGLPTGLEILHATAPELDGPWTEHDPSELHGVDHITERAAPGVIAEGERLHLFLQHGYDILGGAIEHLSSDDGGASFAFADTALTSVPSSPEAGVYDPDPALIDGQPHLVYAAMAVVAQPELYLARSASGGWDGPWERLGRILGHEEVEFHNQLDDEDYEWGLEGPQLLQLDVGGVLLTAVCFLSEHPRGSRQRVVLARADDATGPFELLGPIVAPTHPGGENGHGTAVRAGSEVHLVFQERHGDGRPWHVRRVQLPDA